jgi:hypothetical protein
MNDPISPNHQLGIAAKLLYKAPTVGDATDGSGEAAP